MASRVLLNSSALKVSKPGHNVLTAGAGQLQFSSDWSQLGGDIEGTHAVTWATSGRAGNHSATINFGKSFPTPPCVFFDRNMGGGRWMPLGDAAGFLYHIQGNTDEGGITSYFYVLATVSTSSISVQGRYLKWADNVSVPGFSFRFRVLEYNI